MLLLFYIYCTRDICKMCKNTQNSLVKCVINKKFHIILLIFYFNAFEIDQLLFKAIFSHSKRFYFLGILNDLYISVACL